MGQFEKSSKSVRLAEWKRELAFLAAVGAFIFLWAVIQPLNAAPDETMRYEICDFIYRYKELPAGHEPLLRSLTWGYSYAFFPILSYMVSAVFMMFTSLFTTDAAALLMSARMVNILLGAGTAYFALRIGEKVWGRSLYKWMFAVFTMLMPQVLFIFSYVNNDGLALFSTAIIFYMWLKGIETDWEWKSCVGLAVGIVLCALSYYNAYGIILASILLLALSLFQKGKSAVDRKLLLKKGIVISLIVLVGISWWFIRSYVLYDGDILGMTTSEHYSELYGMEDYKPSNRKNPLNTGVSLWGMLFGQKWILTTAKSFIGCFGYMSIPLKAWMYLVYALLVLTGFAGLGIYAAAGKRAGRLRNAVLAAGAAEADTEGKESLSEDANCNPSFRKAINSPGFVLCMLLAVLLPNVLNLYHSYMVDFQPQGRYSMPMLFPFFYFCILGWELWCRKGEKRSLKRRAAIGAAAVWAVLTAVVYVTIFLPVYQ